MSQPGLNEAIAALIEKKHQLSQVPYNDDRYDDLEEELHDMEDAFVDEYGDYLEEVLTQVHQQIAPETEVLLPTAYLPSHPNPAAVEEARTSGKRLAREGVWVEAEDFPGKEARLMLLANPCRLILSTDTGQQREVWSA